MRIKFYILLFYIFVISYFNVKDNSVIMAFVTCYLLLFTQIFFINDSLRKSFTRYKKYLVLKRKRKNKFKSKSLNNIVKIKKGITMAESKNESIENNTANSYCKKIEHITLETFKRDLEKYVDKLKDKKLDELFIETPFKNDVVVLPIKEYERIKNLYEKVVNQNVK
jgi:hypothetical protein